MKLFFGPRCSFFFRLSLLLILALLSLKAVPVSAAERMAVKVSLANVRTQADINSEIAWQVTKFHPFEVLEKKGDWYLCRDFEGDRGWLYKDLLDKTVTVISLKENCNVRSGPSINSQVIFIVDREVCLKVIKRQGRWLQVVHEDGDQGWIHASLVW